MTYTTKRCPYCKHAYIINAWGDQIKYGSPLITCRVCRKQFWDSDIKEPALYGFDNEFERRKHIKTTITMILYGVLGLILCIFTIISMNFIAMLLVLPLCGYIFVVIYNEIEHRSQNISNHVLIVEEQQKQYDQSLKRLQNIDYLRGLATIDYKAEFLLKDIENGEEPLYADRPE